MRVKSVRPIQYTAPESSDVNNFLWLASEANGGDQLLFQITLSDLSEAATTLMAQEGVKLSDLKDNLLPLILGLQSLLKRAIPIEEYLRVAMYETTTYSAARSFAAVRNLLNFFGIQLDDVILPEQATTTWRFAVDVAARAASELNMNLGELKLDDLPIVLGMAASFGLEECKTTLWSLSEKVRFPKPYLPDDQRYRSVNIYNGCKLLKVQEVLNEKIFACRKKLVFEKLAQALEVLGQDLENDCRADFNMNYQVYLDLVASAVVEIGLEADDISDYLANCLITYSSDRICAYGTAEAFEAAGEAGKNVLFNEVGQVVAREGTDFNEFQARDFMTRQDVEAIEERISGMFDYQPRQALGKSVTWAMVRHMVASAIHFYNIQLAELSLNEVKMLVSQAAAVLIACPESWVDYWAYVVASWVNWLLSDRSEDFAPSQTGFEAWKTAGEPRPDPLEGPLYPEPRDDDGDTAMSEMEENMERIEGSDFWMECDEF